MNATDCSDFYHQVLYREDATAVYKALIESGHNDLAKKIADGARRTEEDYRIIAAFPEIDQYGLSYDATPFVLSSEEGGWVMLWYWVDKKDVEEYFASLVVHEFSDYQI